MFVFIVPRAVEVGTSVLKNLYGSRWYAWGRTSALRSTTSRLGFWLLCPEKGGEFKTLLPDVRVCVVWVMYAPKCGAGISCQVVDPGGSW